MCDDLPGQDSTFICICFLWILELTFRDVYDAFETPSARVPLKKCYIVIDPAASLIWGFCVYCEWKNVFPKLTLSS